MTDLVRLDLGHNEITEIPDQISRLTSLEQLWVNSNPVRTISPELYQCSKLKVIDLRDTEIKDVPREVGRLKNLVEFDLRGNNLRSKLDVKAGNVNSVMGHLSHKDIRKQLKIKLEKSLREGVRHLKSVFDRHL
jgi:Leucine-rich repeat (LRR) protein